LVLFKILMRVVESEYWMWIGSFQNFSVVGR
jgi:hypothetical protein